MTLIVYRFVRNVQVYTKCFNLRCKSKWCIKVSLLYQQRASSPLILQRCCNVLLKAFMKPECNQITQAPTGMVPCWCCHSLGLCWELRWWVWCCHPSPLHASSSSLRSSSSSCSSPKLGKEHRTHTKHAEVTMWRWWSVVANQKWVKHLVGFCNLRRTCSVLRWDHKLSSDHNRLSHKSPNCLCGIWLYLFSTCCPVWEIISLWNRAF